jgi:transposase
VDVARHGVSPLDQRYYGFGKFGVLPKESAPTRSMSTLFRCGILTTMIDRSCISVGVARQSHEAPHYAEHQRGPSACRGRLAGLRQKEERRGIGRSGREGEIHDRYDLTDVEWRVIEPLLPNKSRGVPRVSDRRMLNGIFWVLRSGAPWRDLLERYGPAHHLLQSLRAMAKGGCVESTDGRHHRRSRRRRPDDRQHLRSRPPAGFDGKKEVADHCLGLSRGGLTTKIHVVVDAQGLQLAS